MAEDDKKLNDETDAEATETEETPVEEVVAAASEPEAAEEPAAEPEPEAAPVAEAAADEPAADEPAAEEEPAAEPEPEAEPVAEAAADEPAAEPPVRESGPVEGDSGEPGGSPAESGAAEAAEESPAAEAAEEAPAAAAPQSGPKPKRKRLPRSQRPQKTRPTREKASERKPIVRLEKPEHERGRSQERQGTVVSDKMDKTIVVEVDTIKAHAKYKKVVRRSNKFHAHDERNQAKTGDVVRIVETRPLSATKRWRLAEIVEVAK